MKRPFRISAAVVTALSLATLTAAQQMTFHVRHQHAKNGGEGVLVCYARSIRFQETGNNAEHSSEWRYSDIQRLELREDKLRIVAYEEAAWESGRERRATFDHLPADMGEQLYPLLRARLGHRFVTDAQHEAVHPLWSIAVILSHGRGGIDGVLQVAEDRIVFKADDGRKSRTWRLTDILTVTSSGAFQLSLVTMRDEFRFQLKQPLPHERFSELRRSVTAANALGPSSIQIELREHEWPSPGAPIP